MIILRSPCCGFFCRAARAGTAISAMMMESSTSFEIMAAITLREWLTREWMLIVSGVVSILFGIVLFAAPGEGAIALVTTIGIFSIILGGSLIGLALRLRGLDQGPASRGAGMGTVAGI